MFELGLLLAVVGALGGAAWGVLALRRRGLDGDASWDSNRMEPVGATAVIAGAAATQASVAPTPIADTSIALGAQVHGSAAVKAGG